jgi:hypothetical protein
MRKAMAIGACLLLAVSAFAQMDDWASTSNKLIGAQAYTNTATLRGYIESIYVKPTGPASAATGTVTVSSDEQVIFVKSGITAATWYSPRFSPETTNGTSLLAYSIGGGVTNSVYEKCAVAGKVKFTIAQVSPTASTNYWDMKVIFSKP